MASRLCVCSRNEWMRRKASRYEFRGIPCMSSKHNQSGASHLALGCQWSIQKRIFTYLFLVQIWKSKGIYYSASKHFVTHSHLHSKARHACVYIVLYFSIVYTLYLQTCRANLYVSCSRPSQSNFLRFGVQVQVALFSTPLECIAQKHMWKSISISTTNR